MKPGDVVYLRNNPNCLMTVERVRMVDEEEGIGLVDCVWFDINNNVNRGIFSFDTLSIKEMRK